MLNQAERIECKQNVILNITRKGVSNYSKQSVFFFFTNQYFKMCYMKFSEENKISMIPRITIIEKKGKYFRFENLSKY